MPCGTSSYRLRKAFSRMISAQITRSGWSVTISSGKYLGPTGIAATNAVFSASTLSPWRAETENTRSNPSTFKEAKRGISCSGVTKSVLFTARNLGHAIWRTSSRIAASRSPKCAPSTTASTASTSSRAASASCIMNSPRRLRGLCKPGVSTNTICQPSPAATPRMRLRVVCGRSETIATFSPTKRFIKLDFPTLGRPRIATNPE